MTSTPQRGIGTAETILGAAVMVVAGVLPIALLAAFAVRIEDTLGISDAAVGAALSVFFAVSVLFAVPAGRLADRLGPTKALTVAAALTMASLLGAAGLARNYPTLLGFFVVGGIGQALAAPTANVIVAAGIRPERIGFAMGVKQASVPLGSFIAGIAVTVTADDVSWRWPFALAAVIPAIAIGNAYRIRRGGPGDVSVLPVRQGAAATVRGLWRFVAAGGLCTFTASAVTGFVVLGLVDAGYSEATAGIVLSVAGLASIAARVGSGYLKDRIQFATLHGVVVLLLSGTLGFAFMVSGLPVLVPIGAVVAFSAGWGWPALFQLSLIEMYPAAPGAATGVARLGLAGGNSIGPLFFGIMFELYGYRTGWAIAGLGMVAAAWAVRAAGKHAARMAA